MIAMLLFAWGKSPYFFVYPHTLLSIGNRSPPNQQKGIAFLNMSCRPLSQLLCPGTHVPFRYSLKVETHGVVIDPGLRILQANQPFEPKG